MVSINRTNALLVKPPQGKTYADLLKTIKSRVKPDEHSAGIKTICKTRDGAILSEFDRKTSCNANFTEAVKSAVGSVGMVTNLTPRTLIEVRDIDSTTTESDVCEALTRDLGDSINIRRIGMSKNVIRGQKIVFIELEHRDAQKMLSMGHIKIRWTSCRVRLRAITSRFYNCLGCDHALKMCKGPDRSNLCYKCRKADHKAALCKTDAHCVLCAAALGQELDANHVPVTERCTVYRSALTKD